MGAPDIRYPVIGYSREVFHIWRHVRPTEVPIAFAPKMSGLKYADFSKTARSRQWKLQGVTTHIVE